jgi:hypothetical protein
VGDQAHEVSKQVEQEAQVIHDQSGIWGKPQQSIPLQQQKICRRPILVEPNIVPNTKVLQFWCELELQYVQISVLMNWANEDMWSR